MISRGIRNNNPLNIRKTNISWRGKKMDGKDPDFEQFDTMYNGIREFKLNFGDGTQTMIGHTEITEITEKADAWYTVNGVKLSGKPRVRGIYVKNGKKVVVK